MLIKKPNIFFLIFLFFSLCNFSCKKTEEQPCVKSVWYADDDFDGKGNKSKTMEACVQPAGYVANATDDDDNPVKVFTINAKGYITPKTYDGMKLVWADEFEGTSLDEKNWNYEIGNNNGWGNHELEYYKKENTSLKDGYLVVQAKQESVESFGYTSSRLTTQNKVNLKFGRVDVRGLLPKGKGIWPAFWMLGKNINTVGWPKCGELDIMELIGGTNNDNTVYGTPHWDNAGSHASYGGNTKLASGIFNDEFHVFSIVWDAKKIVWLLDDKKYHEIDITPEGLSELREEFFFIINLAVGGDWPGNPDGSASFPQYLVVDYVRFFQ